MHGTSGPERAPDGPAAAAYGGLPADLSTFVGRGPAVDGLVRRLVSGGERLVTVVGVGGVGKSRLAVRAAREALRCEAGQKRYCDGGALVGLAAVRDGDLLDHTLLEALGSTDQSCRPPRQVLADHLADRELLLVLDGCEQVAGACAAVVRDLLARCSGLRVLVTARRPLRVDGESVVALAPLAPDEAVELFTARAAAALPGFSAGADRDAVAEVCARLDGIPLALELAAGRLPVLSVRQLLGRLDDRFRLLTAGGRRRSPGTARCGRRSAGATNCARPGSGCCGPGCPSSPGPSTWTPPHTPARDRSCPRTTSSTCSAS